MMMRAKIQTLIKERPQILRLLEELMLSEFNFCLKIWYILFNKIYFFLAQHRRGKKSSWDAWLFSLKGDLGRIEISSDKKNYQKANISAATTFESHISVYGWNSESVSSASTFLCWNIIQTEELHDIRGIRFCYDMFNSAYT